MRLEIPRARLALLDPHVVPHDHLHYHEVLGPDHSLFDVLMSLFTRSVNVDQDGIGWIPVLLRPGRTAPGLKGRIFSDIGRVPAQEAPAKKRKGSEGAVDARAEFMKQLPPEIRKKIEMGVPDTLVGRSAFAFKKLASPWIRPHQLCATMHVKNRPGGVAQKLEAQSVVDIVAEDICLPRVVVEDVLPVFCCVPWRTRSARHEQARLQQPRTKHSGIMTKHKFLGKAHSDSTASSAVILACPQPGVVI